MVIDYATMDKITKIHTNKRPIRRHFLAEWLEARGLKPMDLVDLLNDPERSADYTEVDKVQVYRWLKGQMPQAAMQLRIAAALGFEDDPTKFLRPPEADWIMDFFQDRSREELERIRIMLEAAFPKHGDKNAG